MEESSAMGCESVTGLELRLLRVKKGLSQWTLARAAGIQPARISEMETGKRPVVGAVITALDRLAAESQGIRDQ